MKFLILFLFFLVGFCEDTLKKKQVLKVVQDRKLFSSTIKKITHHPLMTVLCVPQMLMDLFKTITRSWPDNRKLQQVNNDEFKLLLPLLQVSKNQINQRNIETHYKKIGRFLKDNFFDITVDQFNKNVYMDMAEAYYDQQFQYQIPDLDKKGFMQMANVLYKNKVGIRNYFNKKFNKKKIQKIK